MVICLHITKDTVCSWKHNPSSDHLPHNTAYWPDIHWKTKIKKQKITILSGKESPHSEHFLCRPITRSPIPFECYMYIMKNTSHVTTSSSFCHHRSDEMVLPKSCTATTLSYNSDCHCMETMLLKTFLDLGN